MISRAQWGAKGGRGGRARDGLSLVVVHHTHSPALAPHATEAEEIAAVRGIERHHVEQRGFQGIAYNWLIAPSGRLYEGRGWGFAGSHSVGQNSTSVGVCFIQDGNRLTLSTRAVVTARNLLAEGAALRHLSPAYDIKGHRDFHPTECPGSLIYTRLEELRPPVTTESVADRLRAVRDEIDAIIEGMP